jgi:hypothetical protein
MKALLLMMLIPPLTSAEVNRSWDTLAATIDVGKKVVVTRMNGSKAEGELLSIDGESITVKVKKTGEKVSRENVLRVRYADIRMGHTLLGLVIGFGAGAAIGVKSGGGGYAALGVGGIGAGIGSATGGALPIGAPLYEVRRK